MPLNVPYTAFPVAPSPAFPQGVTVHRPVLQVALVNPANGLSFSCLGIADTGADYCIFPLSFAVQLGLDPAKMPTMMTGGVGNTANVTHFAQLELRTGFVVGDPKPQITLNSYIGFSPGMEAWGGGLLGHAGFMEHFKLMFDHQAKMFYIEK